MPGLELLDFQQTASSRLLDGALNYYASGPDKLGGRIVPYVAQLKAVTGAGKTPILANVIGRLNPSIILWTTKYGSVVDQTVANLRSGGKYHHLLGGGHIEIIKFTEIPSTAEWTHILERKDGLTILVSTVAAWNSSEKDERLNVHRVNTDWGEKSRWDQLKQERKRSLWVVYDEAHNTTTEQVELLDDLDPAGFFVASASPLKGKLQLYLTHLPEEARKDRFVPVKTRDVAEAQLLKSTISLADYESSPEEMIRDVAKRRDQLEKKLKKLGVQLAPKAIYVVETSGISVKGADPRPIAIWKTLVNSCKVPPQAIAICTNTKDLPPDAVRAETIDDLSDEYLHIIFNKKLQEGWDDPSVYVCYLDGKTESVTRIQQVLGRALRQPNAKHFTDEDLNTSFFFFNCPNELLESITDRLKEELRIYKDDDSEEFEPFTIKKERLALPKIPLKPKWVDKLRVPNLQLELPKDDRLRKLVVKRTYDFSEEERSASGRAVVNIVSVKTGEVSQASRNLLEDMRVRCGAYLQEQIRIRSKNCINGMHPGIFSNQKLDKGACYKSKALEHYHDVALEVVREYEAHVQLTKFSDKSEQEYTVDSFQPSGEVSRPFNNAGHPAYDSTSFRPDELEFAKALDKFPKYVWVRNKDRLDYGIPLCIKSGSSSTFYPDFLWWVKKSVWAIDPTGQFILEEKIRTKLLAVPLPLRIALVTRGKLDQNYKQVSDGGWTLTRLRSGNSSPETFDSLQEMLELLEDQS